MTKIDSFKGETRWLSNFHMEEIIFKGVRFPSVEHAFQAMKCEDRAVQEEIRACKTPGQAKRMGKKVKLRPNWEQIKLGLMEELTRIKFKIPHLRAQLLDTGDAELIEGNNWGDCFWGVCNGVGQNHLGKILMKIRQEIRDDQGRIEVQNVL